MASSTRVTLTREQRDGLADHLGLELQGCGDKFSHAVSAWDRGKVQDLLGRVTVCAEILDQLGWEECGGKNTYELTVTEQMKALIAAMLDEIRAALRDSEGFPEGDTRSRLLKIDRGALSAATEVLAVAA